MEKWKIVCGMLENVEDIEKVRQEIYENSRDGVYPDSVNYLKGSYFFLAWVNGAKKLVIYPEGELSKEFSGDEAVLQKGKAKICGLNVENARLIRKAFPFTMPSSHKGIETTLGLGDRLGLASAGHLRLLKSSGVFPVLAQQSIRELNLTGRTYDEVLSAASWAVFQEGYTCGFGADGDHLKTPEEVQMAIDCGFTMITLDCSEHINNSVSGIPQDEVNGLYSQLTPMIKDSLESKYLGKTFELGDGHQITYTEDEFKRIVLTYIKANHYTIKIYQEVIKNCGRDIDFEMSIDETLTPTTPESHYFVARELLDGGVRITSLAPRFCGEFQKGIDYIGDTGKFAGEFEVHVQIAQTLGYKIRVHSGSDKFTVFPIIGKLTGGKYHLKTAGTNWLEAVRVIAEREPALYREMHQFALEHLEEAKKYYHIGADTARIPNIEQLADAQLPQLMDMEDARQVLHITYGLILQARNSDGSFTYRDNIYTFLNDHEDAYYAALQKHIGKHLEKLGIVK